MRSKRSARAWWLLPKHAEARCVGTRIDDGKRCKNMATAEGLCGLHARMKGGKAAAEPAGWTRTQIELGYCEAQKRIAALEALLNSAPIADFLESVRVEAAHQVERWGVEQDDGKAPTDWLWLLGYLATKATTSATLGDTKKALHHVVTSAAVLLNWHARLSGHDRGFRPGSAEPSGG